MQILVEQKERSRKVEGIFLLLQLLTIPLVGVSVIGRIERRTCCLAVGCYFVVDLLDPNLFNPSDKVSGSFSTLGVKFRRSDRLSVVGTHSVELVLHSTVLIGSWVTAFSLLLDCT